MGGKNPLVIVVGLLFLLIALAFYQWTVMSENALLKQENGQVREVTGKLRKARDDLQNQLTEISMNLDDKKRYISDIDDKFLKANAELESKNNALNGCMEEKKKVGDNAEKQKNEFKSKEDQIKKMEEEKKKVETDLEEYKKLCTVANMTTDLAKKLCPQQVVVQPKK
ncbi:protein GOLM2-like isoform X2 [Heterodontus francisci]